MEKKYQIFISSTFADLKEERQAVSRAILDMGHIAAGMEMFPAQDVEQLTYIKKVIDECDYYVLIIGARYGSLDEDGVSYTEREFQYAVDTGKPVLAFLPHHQDLIPIGKSDKDDEKRKKLEQFISSVKSGRLIQYWESTLDLKAKAIISLNQTFSNNPQVGWIRADKVASETAMSDVIRLGKENERLTRELDQLKANIMPNFEDAAGLDTQVMIKFRYSPRGEVRIVPGAYTLTLAEFLKWMGSDLHTATTLGNICSAMSRALRERAGYDGSSFNTNQASVSDALMHLVATGHLRMWPSSLKDGQGVTAYQLTELGVRAWQEMSYIKDEHLA